MFTVIKGQLHGLSAWMQQVELKGDEEVVDTLVLPGSLKLRGDAKDVLSILNSTMFPDCSVQNVDSQSCVDKEESQHAESVTEYVDFILVEPPSCVCWVRNAQNWS